MADPSGTTTKLLVLAAVVVAPLLCCVGAMALFRSVNRTDLTVEVVNRRGTTVPAVVVDFVGRECGPTDVVPGQTVTCRYDRGKGGLEFRLGPERLVPDDYVMGGRPTLRRLTLDADGGATFECVRGYCYPEDGGSRRFVALRPQASSQLHVATDAGARGCEDDCSPPGCFWYGSTCYRRCESDAECGAGQACVCPDAARCLYPTIADEMPNPGKHFCVRVSPRIDLEVVRRRREVLAEARDAGTERSSSHLSD